MRELTWSLTLAVSSGKVTKSAMHAAVPAPTNFTAAVGGRSAGPKPTIFMLLQASEALNVMFELDDVNTR